MTPLTAENPNFISSDKAAFDTLYGELLKGIQNVKNGEVYTIEEAWEEIDQV